MKKKQFIFGFVLLLVTIAAMISYWHFSSVTYNNQSSQTKVAVLDADYDLMNDINEVDRNATLIVKGKFIGNRTLKEWVDEPTNTVTATASKSEIRVEKVLKGELKKKEIAVYEPAYFMNDTFVSIEGYNLMQERHNYLLFLKPMIDDDTYVIVGMYQGKYDLDSPDPVKRISSIKEYKNLKDIEYFGDHIEEFNKLKKQVKEKYQLN
ncbi:hypothetical protein PNH38_01175 [Anoxybacillus rupiensis]|jgi:hypothetical protein|uniref:Uncharacterized protein n=1 Tax=Anoxybacteroides rupiense TaxID=311460 RepID=A0ABD5IWD2_9BACL|nr:MULTISPECIES: hypothetical protein [Anoxybacillus]KXG11171.1 hypothetical protein AT864_00254 [Anoxybacillus sp. P3H1B]MBB3906749.1 hypothetical protein [Anoxybacillus rupiensis]MBS2770136.1 hypothetical protein [Anoxybacillus rupiensis]MDE8562490.1 hypothetical protein [Anoxybacillus rupiensis]MED5052119.1 hypothetical protein [Anoxybacillus rupiensis]